MRSKNISVVRYGENEEYIYMSNKFQWTFFADCDINDVFFDSLKRDYAEFETWFAKKAQMGQKLCIYREKNELLAMLYLKDETEELLLRDEKLECCRRLKIGTLKISDYAKHQRLGEGAIGLSLWYWQRMGLDEVYITVFKKHAFLIKLLCKFGFAKRGTNERGEEVYIKSKSKLDYTDPYTAFPYIMPDFKYCGYLPIKDGYHDTLFPYSELANTNQETEEIAAANGVTKSFIASPYKKVKYYSGEPVFVYRIHTGTGKKKYKSVVTSICTIVRQIVVKENGICRLSYKEFIATVGNKSYYSSPQLTELYDREHLVILEMVYNGGFGKGHNVTYNDLNENGLFEEYPYHIQLTSYQFKKILELGGINVRHFIINQT